MRNNRWRAALLLAVALLTAVVGGDSAFASCAGEFKPKRASWVFVGTVARQDTSKALIDVDQVWRGRDLAPQILVQTGEQQPPWPISLFVGVGGSGDITLEPGQTYVVALTDGPGLRTNACLVTEATPDQLAKAPAEARGPVAGALSGISPLGWVMPVLWGTLGLAAVTVLLIVRRRRRS